MFHAPPRELGHSGLLEAPTGTVLLTAEGYHVRLAPGAPAELAPCASLISAAHRVGTDERWHSSLMALLREQQQTQLAELLAFRPVRLGEWFAEHARSQLAPDSGCTSHPLWVAWCASWAALEEGGAADTLFVALWAADARAARRAVDELRLGAVGRATHVLLQRGLLPELERRAFEQSDVELQMPSSHEQAGEGAGWSALPVRCLADSSAAPSKLWATLQVRSGSDLEQLQLKRAAAAEKDDAVAQKKQQALADQLKAQDPKAHISISKEATGQYVINELVFNGHIFDASLCRVCINPFSDVSDIIKTVTYRCQCC